VPAGSQTAVGAWFQAKDALRGIWICVPYTQSSLQKLLSGLLNSFQLLALVLPPGVPATDGQRKADLQECDDTQDLVTVQRELRLQPVADEYVVDACGALGQLVLAGVQVEE